MDAGATSADTTARKLRKAANLAQRDGRLRDDGVVGDKRWIIGVTAYAGTPHQDETAIGAV